MKKTIKISINKIVDASDKAVKNVKNAKLRAVLKAAFIIYTTFLVLLTFPVLYVYAIYARLKQIILVYKSIANDNFNLTSNRKDHETITSENLIIIDGCLFNTQQCNILLHRRNILISAVVNTTSGPIILIDRFYNDLSDIGKKFALYHEIGHVKLGHLNNLSEEESDKNLKARIKGDGTQLKIEFDADAYAASCIGIENAISALREFKHVNPLSAREVNKRIKQLKEGTKNE